MIADGTPADTPAAFVFGAGGDRETVIQGELEELCDRVDAEEFQMPGLFIVGEVARPVFSRQSGALGGRRVLLTCSETLIDRARRMVYDLGGVPVARPMIRLSPRPEALQTVRRIGGYDWIVVTSPSAVRFLMHVMERAGVEVRALPKVIVAGPGTAGAFGEFHVRADAVPAAEFGGAGVRDLAESAIGQGSRVLRLKSDKTGSALADSLRALGLDVDECVLYHNRPVLYDRVPPFEAVFFASGSAVHGLMAQWGPAVLEDGTTLAIGEPTAQVLQQHGVEPDVVSPKPTVEGSLFALARYYVRRKLEELR
jgi:uroporphyrinogen III methyltransferase/synthase